MRFEYIYSREEEQVEAVKKNEMTSLKALGIKMIRVPFSGGNDEGFVEPAQIVYTDGASATHNRYAQEKDQQPVLDPISADLVERPIWNRYGSFAGDFYVHGSLIWDIEKEHVYFEGEESTYVPIENSVVDITDG